MSAEELDELMLDGDNGLCLTCGEWTGGVEPDARKYKCEACGHFSVYGVEEIMIALL